jgi:hypothetical protein
MKEKIHYLSAKKTPKKLGKYEEKVFECESKLHSIHGALKGNDYHLF